MKREKIWLRRYQKIGFLGMPDEVIVALGKGIEKDPLSAFDKAELDACIPDINAIVVTSFIPPGASLITPDRSKKYLESHPIVPGSLVPVALKYFSTTKDKQLRSGVEANSIFAAISIVIPDDEERFPSIMMEYAGPTEKGEPETRIEVENYCTQMALRVADLRKNHGFRPIDSPKVWVVEQELPDDCMWACVLAAGVYVRKMHY